MMRVRIGGSWAGGFGRSARVARRARSYGMFAGRGAPRARISTRSAAARRRRHAPPANVNLSHAARRSHHLESSAGRTGNQPGIRHQSPLLYAEVLRWPLMVAHCAHARGRERRKRRCLQAQARDIGVRALPSRGQRFQHNENRVATTQVYLGFLLQHLGAPGEGDGEPFTVLRGSKPGVPRTARRIPGSGPIPALAHLGHPYRCSRPSYNARTLVYFTVRSDSRPTRQGWPKPIHFIPHVRRRTPCDSP